ncbi:MAG: anti-sigma factor [Acidobacteriota bacterium]
MDCRKSQKLLNAYLDDCLTWREGNAVSEHLDACPRCQLEYRRLRAVSQTLRSLRPLEIPADLTLRIRIAASKEQCREFPLTRLAHRFGEFIRPVAIPAFSGVVLTCLFFVAVLASLLSGAKVNASDNDVPLGLSTPPRAKSLWMSHLVQGDNFKSIKKPITVETFVDSRGGVLAYRIIDGPHDAETRRTLDQFFYFQLSFDAATKFGRPTSGKIVLSFSEIDVMG